MCELIDNKVFHDGENASVRPTLSGLLRETGKATVGSVVKHLLEANHVGRDRSIMVSMMEGDAAMEWWSDAA
jgi:hypothetical protein